MTKGATAFRGCCGEPWIAINSVSGYGSTGEVRCAGRPDGRASHRPGDRHPAAPQASTTLRYMRNMTDRRVLGIVLLIGGIILVADAVIVALGGGRMPMVTVLWSLLLLGLGVIALAKR